MFYYSVICSMITVIAAITGMTAMRVGRQYKAIHRKKFTNQLAENSTEFSVILLYRNQQNGDFVSGY